MVERNAAIFFDRDGTIIEHVPYLSCPNDVRLLPESRRALELASISDVKLFLHTNQSAVGRGMCSMEDVHRCNDRMLELLNLGNVFSDICIASEAPGCPSKYRKPSPNYALEKIKEFSLIPSRVFYIGDRITDLKTALAAGVRGIGVNTGLVDLNAELIEAGLSADFPVCSDLYQAVSLAMSYASRERR